MKVPAIEYPPAERQDIVDVLHGQRVPDPYRWLEDPADPRTRDWLAAQDDLWRRHAAALPCRESLRAKAVEFAGAGLITAPLWRGDRRFFMRRAAGQEHAVLYVARGAGAEDAVVDAAALDPSGLTTLDSWQPDLDGGLLAYQLSRRGDEQSELYVLDVDTGQVIDGPIDRCRYSPVVWLPGGKAFYYIRSAGPRGTHREGTPPHAPRSAVGARVYLHRVGTPATSDVPVAGADGDDVVSYGLQGSPDGRWLVLTASPGIAPRNDVWLADLAGSAPESPVWRIVQAGVAARTAAIVGRDGRLYIVTDRDAPRVRLCAADPAAPADWHDLVPEDPEAVLGDFAILDGPELDRSVLLVARIRDTVAEITTHDLATGARLGQVPLPGAGSLGPLSTRIDGGHEAWFTYTDFVTPGAVWRFDARTEETAPWAAAPGTATAAAGVACHQISCSSADGASVRMTVIARAGGGGPRPAILYGYGGFGVPLTPAYAADTMAWVEMGGVVAIAHLRGGGEGGTLSHRAGMLGHKQKVFDDFVSAAEKLIADGWTTPRQLAIWGESNGGLLVGAALTQRPGLFAAAACSMPLLDMVRYEKSGLGSAWTGEYGSAADPEQFRWLLAYSPYHHVREGVDYPATLFTAFGGDTRVDPGHARKMCAALQWATSGTRPILLRHEGDVGHGARAASRSVELAADMLAFLGTHTGLGADKDR
jgi:prolyl oligopeptidase